MFFSTVFRWVRWARTLIKLRFVRALSCFLALGSLVFVLVLCRTGFQPVGFEGFEVFGF